MRRIAEGFQIDPRLLFGASPETEGGLVEVAGALEEPAPCAVLVTDDGTRFALLGNVVADRAARLFVIGEPVDKFPSP